MYVNITKSQGTVKAKLHDALDVAEVAESRDHLLQILEAGDSIRLDFSSLTEIDTAGVQLALALRKEAVALGKDCRFVHPSPPVEEVFRLLGCAGIFDESVLTSQAKG
jgi:anti-sigma B factor antagonist